MNKKAMELSVNFIVMMILAIVVFGFGIKFAKDMFTQSSQLTDTKFEEVDAQIQDLACTTAERVCLPTSTKTLEGSTPAFFGVVIENVLDKQNFKIIVERAGGPDDQGKLDWIPKERNDIEINSKEKYKVGIAVVNEGADPGTYPFKVTVNKHDGTAYSSPQIFYVKVP